MQNEQTQATVLAKPRKVKNTARKRKEYAFIICMLALPILHTLVFWLYANAQSIAMAFQHVRTGEFTFANFVTFWESLTTTGGDLNIAIGNTMTYFSVDILILMPVGLLTSYFLYKRVLGWKVFRIIFYFPAIITALAMTTAYKNFIHPNGPLGMIVELFGGQLPPEGLFARNATATGAIVGYSIWTGLCSGMLLFTGAMVRVPLEVIESAKIEGCGAFREFVQIILPLIWPTISTQIIFKFTGIIGASGAVLLFTQGEFGTTTISYWMFKMVYGSSSMGGAAAQYNVLSAAGMFFTAITVPIILIVRWLMDRIPAVEY